MGVIIDQMTAIYVYVADYLEQHQTIAKWRSLNNAEPGFSDAEVITIGLMQSCLEVDKLKKAYEQIRGNYLEAFPKLCSYKQWIARLHKLTHIIGELFASLREDDKVKLYLGDSKPIAICKPIRHGRVNLLRDEGAYFGKNSTGWFFGFKLHLLRNINGKIVDAILTPANCDDPDPLLALSVSTGDGVLLGDCGYRGVETSQLLAQELDLLLITRADAPQHRHLISCIHQSIETSFSQLWHLFNK